ncbi:MAG: nucleotidyltransferase family protein [Solirubrobacterales bacterium]
MIAGLVLAAGEGRRFGGAKLAAELEGESVLDHAVAAMLGVPAIERVVVVLGAHAEKVLASSDLSEVEWVVCEQWKEGIAASLRTGVQTLADADAEAIVITLGDEPLITAQAIAAIVDRIDTPAPAVRATYDGRPGHPVLIKRELFSEVGRLHGDEGARGLLTATGALEVECGQLCRPDDIDEPEDLRRISAIARGE